MHECFACCTSGWQPGRKCHCSDCGENFSVVSNFDKHRDNGRCLLPVDVGLEQNKRGVWITPGEVDFEARFKGQ